MQLSGPAPYRLFKLQTGLTPSDYVAQLRIGNACTLLANSRKPIAYEVGYRNLSKFNRQFKGLKGERHPTLSAQLSTSDDTFRNSLAQMRKSRIAMATAVTVPRSFDLASVMLIPVH